MQSYNGCYTNAFYWLFNRPVIIVSSFSDAVHTCQDTCCCTCSMLLFSFPNNPSLQIRTSFVHVYSGCVLLFLNQSWVKCTSSNSPRCVAHFGNRFKTICAKSEILEHDDFSKDWSDYFTFPFLFVYIFLYDAR